MLNLFVTHCWQGVSLFDFQSQLICQQWRNGITYLVILFDFRALKFKPIWETLKSCGFSYY